MIFVGHKKGLRIGRARKSHEKAAGGEMGGLVVMKHGHDMSQSWFLCSWGFGIYGEVDQWIFSLSVGSHEFDIHDSFVSYHKIRCISNWHYFLIWTDLKITWPSCWGSFGDGLGYFAQKIHENSAFVITGERQESTGWRVGLLKRRRKVGGVTSHHPISYQFISHRITHSTYLRKVRKITKVLNPWE